MNTCKSIIYLAWRKLALKSEKQDENVAGMVINPFRSDNNFKIFFPSSFLNLSQPQTVCKKAFFKTEVKAKRKRKTYERQNPF